MRAYLCGCALMLSLSCTTDTICMSIKDARGISRKEAKLESVTIMPHHQGSKDIADDNLASRTKLSTNKQAGLCIAA